LPIYAHAPESSIKYVVAAGKCSCVRRGCFGGRSGAAYLDGDNWFRKRDLTRSRKKRARITHRFHVEQNAACARIIAEVIDQIAPVRVGHGSDGNERAEPELC